MGAEDLHGQFHVFYSYSKRRATLRTTYKGVDEMHVYFCLQEKTQHAVDVMLTGDLHREDLALAKGEAIAAQKLARKFRVIDNQSSDGAVSRLKGSDRKHVNTVLLKQAAQVGKPADFVLHEDGKLPHRIRSGGFYGGLSHKKRYKKQRTVLKPKDLSDLATLARFRMKRPSNRR